MKSVPHALTIGDFSRTTHLTVKTLRHYHRVGLLEPEAINPETGYRYYGTDQVPVAQVIRRLRDLEMPIDDVRAVLAAPDITARNTLIAAHLERLERQLQATAAAMTSLRNLIDHPHAPDDAATAIQHRSIAATRSLAIQEIVPRGGLGAWWPQALAALRTFVETERIAQAGPAGGLFTNGLFTDEEGEAALFLPVEGTIEGRGRIRPFLVPAAEVAVVAHHGSHADIDLAYGALGTYVARYALGIEGPLREYYVIDASDTPDSSQWVTEICWPVFQTTDR